MEENRNYHEPCTCNQPGPAPCPIHENKSCRGDKGNCFCLPPKAVPVEVDGCPILFRKVTIPASVGDEETDPPVPGRYRNVLLTYEAGGHAYMYSSDGIPTQLPEKGEKGDAGEQGPQGPVGPTGPQGPQGERGPQGIQGEQGPQGPAGEDGAGIEIAGTVATYADLPTNLTPEDDGKGYYVESEGRLYIWNGTSFPADGDGVHIQGPQGPQGIQGVQGPQGEQGTQGPAGANGSDGFSPVATVTQTATGATITITDAQGTTTANVRNGEDGNIPIATTSVAGKVKPDGTTITVTADGTISSASAYTLPPATTSTLGGVIVGNNLTVDANGTLDATDTTYTAGTNVQISAGNVISATDTTYTAFTGATSSVAGTAGLVPAPTTSDPDKYLKGDGTWSTISQYTPTVFYIDKWLPRYGFSPVSDVHVYKDSALTETASLQDLYDAIDAGGATLVYLNSGLVQTYNFLYALHSPHNGNPDSGGDYMYFAGEDGATLQTSDQSGQSTNNPATLSVSVSGLYSVDVMRGATSGGAGYMGLAPTPASADRTKFLRGDGTWATPTDTTYSDFGGATSSAAGSAGLVPAPTTSDPDKYLKGDGTWANLPSANNISSADWNGLWQ